MRFERPEQIALAVALLSGMGLWLFTPDTGERVWISVFFGLAMGVLVYAMVHQFIYRRLKAIYTILKNPASAAKLANRVPLEQVERDVEQWAQHHEEQIQGLLDREGFRREFMGNLSHELKTPIFNIQGYLFTLLDGGLEDPKVNRKFLEKATKSVDRMTALIQEMDLISRLESGTIALEMGTFDVVKSIKEVFEDLEPLARQSDVELVLKKDKERIYKALGDARKVEQVLHNLVSNGIKYSMPKNGKVTMDILDLEDRYLIQVADNGIGIDEGDLPRIFERFYRVDKSRSRDVGGTGLGLAIAKHIIESHKQQIHATSIRGTGSTFSFTLEKSNNV
jgi:two-component system phosphate regulon sensor histidine kinase PhoR